MADKALKKPLLADSKSSEGNEAGRTSAGGEPSKAHTRQGPQTLTQTRSMTPARGGDPIAVAFANPQAASIAAIQGAKAGPAYKAAPWQKLGTPGHQHHQQNVHPDAAGSWPPPADRSNYRQKQEEEVGEVTEAGDFYTPVRAYFIARGIDTRRLVQAYEGLAIKKPSLIQRKHVLIRFCDRREDDRLPQVLHTFRPSFERYMVVFHYGSVVFFNFTESDQRCELITVSKHITEPLEKASGMPPVMTANFFKKLWRKTFGTAAKRQALKYAVEPSAKEVMDDYAVVTRPSLEEYSEEGTDSIMLKQLDESSVVIVAMVLAQSVALEYYTAKVDGLLGVFGELNASLGATGQFRIDEAGLFTLVAMTNTALADVVINLEILNRSEAAWKLDKYSEVWEIMREVFEVTDRFESLSYKLNVVQTNIQFFLEVLHNKRSDFLEWIIIVLIALELILAIWQIYRGIQPV